MHELKRISAPEAVVDYVREQIESGRLQVGDQLPSERTLQKTFGISRFTLREGLARLNALGILNIRHGKGTFVAADVSARSLDGVFTPLFARQDSQSTRDLIEARNLLETELAVLACGRATKADLRGLLSILEKTEEALNDSETFAQLDYTFHREISTIARNAFLQRMLDTLTGHLKSFLRDYADDARRRKVALANHREIYDCLAQRNARDVGRVMTQHIMRSWKQVTLPKTKKKGKP